MNRRTFCRTLGGSLLAVQGCSKPATPPGPPRARLAALLGLTPAQAPWLDVLQQAEQAELHAALTARAGKPSARAVELVMKVINPRERLMAYVGYPPLPNHLEGCDGLIRE